ncbi:hypothetical protein DL765_009825 [Monosporascus sp. GIB2]|nr:hypothetical protein DL765_009825 [Monosporascus sp. GIB2]
MQRRDIEFPTLDGLTLRGWLFPGAKGGPAVILHNGFNYPKELILSPVAIWFQQHGLTVLVYDARTVGESDGEPRSDLDQRKLIEDMHDAVTFLKTFEWIDHTRIALWGFFWSGTQVLEAASVDKRVAAVVSIGPVLDWSLDPELGPRMMALAMKDREGRVQGKPPIYIPFYKEDGESFMIFKAFTVLSREQRTMVSGMVEGAKEQAPRFVDSVTAQTLYRIANWSPFSRFTALGSTPTMLVIPEIDELSDPALQHKTFESFEDPKVLEVAKEKGHFNYWYDADLDQLLAGQLKFLKEYLKF